MFDIGIVTFIRASGSQQLNLCVVVKAYCSIFLHFLLSPTTPILGLRSHRRRLAWLQCPHSLVQSITSSRNAAVQAQGPGVQAEDGHGIRLRRLVFWSRRRTLEEERRTYFGGD